MRLREDFAYLSILMPEVILKVRHTTLKSQNLKTKALGPQRKEETSLWIVLIDVKSLYPSMPQHLGIEGVRRALDNRNAKLPSTSNLIECLKICLNENHFEFKGKFFTQINGTSIGPKMAPGYACLGMGLVEEKLWDTCPLKPTEWCRFIDDIWGLWPHGRDAFLSFIEILTYTLPNWN